MAASPNENRDRLAARLRALRAATGLSGNRFAETVIDWGQSKVSKLERGAQLPSDADLEAWTRATDPVALNELRALLAAARVEYASFRGDRQAGGSLAAYQAKIEQVEASSTRIGEYQPSLIPGLAHTSAYADEAYRLPPGPGEALDDREIADAVGVRMRRQDVLYRPGKRVQMVMGEAALWAAPGGVDVLRGQLEKLEVVARLSAVELGVVPLRAMPVLSVSGFRLYDDNLVMVETIAGEHELRNADDVRGFADAFDLLLSHAATGAEAVQRVRAVLAALDEE